MFIHLKMAQESEVKLTIGEERVDSKDVTKGQEIDMKFRDPEHLHDSMKVRMFSLLADVGLLHYVNTSMYLKRQYLSR